MARTKQWLFTIYIVILSLYFTWIKIIVGSNLQHPTCLTVKTQDLRPFNVLQIPGRYAAQVHIQHFVKELVSNSNGITSEVTQEVMSALSLVDGMPGIGETVTLVRKFMNDRAAMLSANNLLGIMAQETGHIDVAKCKACLENVDSDKLKLAEPFKASLDGFLKRLMHQLIDKACSCLWVVFLLVTPWPCSSLSSHVIEASVPGFHYKMMDSLELWQVWHL